VVLTIELEGALPSTPGATAPAKLTSPYRAPLTKFLVKYAPDSVAYFLAPTRMQVRHSACRNVVLLSCVDIVSVSCRSHPSSPVLLSHCN